MKRFFIISVYIIAASLTINTFSQGITGTMGTNGIFSIKNSSSNYLTINQSSGEVNILKTLEISASTGAIYMGANRFMHSSGNNNVFLGENSGNFTLTGPWNTGAGSNTLTFLTNGNSNTAFGNLSLNKNTSGNENSAFGLNSLKDNTTGKYNSAFGSSSLSQNSTAEGNSAFGYLALSGINSGNYNSAFGYNSLWFNTSGTMNSGFGGCTLLNNTSGSQNTALGINAGSIITNGTNLTCLGYNSQPSSGSAANQVTLGNSSVTVLRSTVTTIASLSDSRDKKNIKDLTLGIDFLMTIKPRLYNWDKREWYENNISDGTKMQETPTAGFIAQELDDAQTIAGAEWLNLVLKDNPEKWEATPGNLLPVIVKSVQELNMEIEQLNNESGKLVSKDKEFEERILKFEQMQNTLMYEAELLRKNNTDLKEIKSVTK